jgi:hypothetical protein
MPAWEAFPVTHNPHCVTDAPLRQLRLWVRTIQGVTCTCRSKVCQKVKVQDAGHPETEQGLQQYARVLLHTAGPLAKGLHQH